MKLPKLQRWLQAVVVHPGTTEEALKSPRASALLKRSELESVMRPSKTLTAAQRLQIYQEMYPMRMRDALSSDYPALEHFLGDGFWDFVVAYTKKHPSMGYTLNRLGDHMPAFVGRQTKLKNRAFLHDLTRLELAVTEAFDSAEAPVLRAEDLDALGPSKLPKARLRTAPSLRLLTLSWNADAYLDTLRDEDHHHPKPKRADSFVVIVRRNYSVYRFAVPESEFLVLQDLKAGKTIGKAVEKALARRGKRRPAPELFGTWFGQWTSQGLFSEIEGVRTTKAKSKGV
ncbi:MAG: putative DNA-binding domain-containing protein [Vicinamibacteria bacterium]